MSVHGVGLVVDLPVQLQVALVVALFELFREKVPKPSGKGRSAITKVGFLRRFAWDDPLWIGRLGSGSRGGSRTRNLQVMGLATYRLSTLR